MSELIASIIILLLCSLPLVIIGIVQYNSKTPAGFWSGKKPPDSNQITDVSAYNKKHGIMWILYGLGFPISFLCALPFSEILATAATLIECLGGLLIIIAYHNKLDRQYLKK